MVHDVVQIIAGRYPKWSVKRSLEILGMFALAKSDRFLALQLHIFNFISHPLFDDPHRYGKFISRKEMMSEWCSSMLTGIFSNIKRLYDYWLIWVVKWDGIMRIANRMFSIPCNILETCDTCISLLPASHIRRYARILLFTFLLGNKSTKKEDWITKPKTLSKFHLHGGEGRSLFVWLNWTTCLISWNLVILALSLCM